ENSDAVTAVSQGLVNQTKNHLHVKKDIEVIYNFVNEADYQKKERTFLKEHYQIKPNEKVIIHISNFRKVKRIRDGSDTFVNINHTMSSKLRLSGDGPEQHIAMKQMKKLQLENQVIFLGKQKNISELLSIVDLKLLMSEQESFGLFLLEALACEV